MRWVTITLHPSAPAPSRLSNSRTHFGPWVKPSPGLAAKDSDWSFATRPESLAMKILPPIAAIFMLSFSSFSRLLGLRLDWLRIFFLFSLRNLSGGGEIKEVEEGWRFFSQSTAFVRMPSAHTRCLSGRAVMKADWSQGPRVAVVKRRTRPRCHDWFLFIYLSPTLLLPPNLLTHTHTLKEALGGSFLICCCAAGLRLQLRPPQVRWSTSDGRPVMWPKALLHRQQCV